MKYISKGDWFDEGTEVNLITDFRPQVNTGLFEGIHTCDNPEAESRQMGEKYWDEEVCPFDEFDVVEEEGSR